VARVVALDNLRRRGSELNLPRLKAGGVEFVHGDVRSASDLQEVGPFDVLIECSAEPSVLAGYNSGPAYVTDTNLVGTIHCLEAARRHGAGLVLLSTSRVYPIAKVQALRLREAETRLELEAEQPFVGVGERGIGEGFPLDGPRSLYGATKLSAELLLLEYAAMYGMPAVINRCGLLTGPGQMGKSDQGVVVLWAARHAYGGRLDYIGLGGSGKQVRDLLHVEDLLDLLLAQLPRLAELGGRIYNIGGGRGISASLLELTAHCERLSGNRIEIGRVAEERPADIPLYLSDTRRAERELGWRPRRGVEETLDEIFRWLRAEEAVLRPILT